MKNIDIELLYKKIDGTASPEELARAQEWISSRDAHRKFYQNLRNNHIGGEMKLPSESRIELNRTVFYGKMKRHDISARRRLAASWWGVAASLLLLAGVGYYLGIFGGGAVTEEQSTDIYAQKTSNGLIELITTDGMYLDLASLAPGELLPEGIGMSLDSQGGLVMEPQVNESRTVSPRISTVVVRRGADLHLKLADGTDVWLNSDSEISFPDSFSGDKREVTVKGETYFDVTRDETKPFIVNAGDSRIRVLGTQFNVNTRHSERIVTTLVSGSVGVSIEGIGSEIKLSPGQTAEADFRRGVINLRNDHPELYTGWRTGTYVFRERRISEVLDELALWHDLEIEYDEPALRNEVFSGSVGRHASLATLINVIERTGHISFQLEGNRLKVSRPKK